MTVELCRLFPAFVNHLADRVVGVQELCESRSGRHGLPVPVSLTVSVDVKQQ